MKKYHNAYTKEERKGNYGHFVSSFSQDYSCLPTAPLGGS